MGISLLKKAGFEAMVFSTETNPVVAARCKKMKLPVYQGVEAKGQVLQNLLEEKGVPGENVIFVGNDVNDLPCFPLVGCAVAVADAHPMCLPQADLMLSKPGGFGAVRELCDLILSHYPDKENLIMKREVKIGEYLCWRWSSDLYCW